MLCASRYRSNSPSDLPPLRAPSAIPVCKCEMSSSCPNWARYGHRMLVTSEQPQKLRRRIADPSEITPELLKAHLHFGIDAQSQKLCVLDSQFIDMSKMVKVRLREITPTRTPRPNAV